jgi:hypothetical protein
MQCDGRFTLVNRRHHCRKCGACVCGKCSGCRLVLLEGDVSLACVANRATLAFLKDTDKPVRVCLSCHELIQVHDVGLCVWCACV